MIIVTVTTKTPDTTAASPSTTPIIDNVSKDFTQYVRSTQKVELLFDLINFITLIHFLYSSYSLIVNRLYENLIIYSLFFFFVLQLNKCHTGTCSGDTCYADFALLQSCSASQPHCQVRTEKDNEMLDTIENIPNRIQPPLKSSCYIVIR